jgi:hypothetical protein
MILIALLMLFILEEIFTYPTYPKMSREEEVSWLMKQCNMTKEEAEHFADV